MIISKPSVLTPELAERRVRRMKELLDTPTWSDGITLQYLVRETLRSLDSSAGSGIMSEDKHKAWRDALEKLYTTATAPLTCPRSREESASYFKKTLQTLESM